MKAQLLLLVLAAPILGHASTMLTEARTWIQGADDAPPECSSAMTGSTVATASFTCTYSPTIHGHTFAPMPFHGSASAEAGFGPYGMGIDAQANAGSQDLFSQEKGTAHALESVTFGVQGSGSLWVVFQMDNDFGPTGTFTIGADGNAYDPGPSGSLQIINPLLLAAGESHTLTLDASVISDMGEPSRFRFFVASATFVGTSQSGPATWDGSTFSYSAPLPSDPLTGVPEPSTLWLLVPATLFVLRKRPIARAR